MGDWGRERGGHRRLLDRGTRGRSAPRHARQDDQREREGPYCSAMKAQDDNPLSRAVQSSTPARFADRQWSISSSCRQPLPMAWHFRLPRLRFPILVPPIASPPPSASSCTGTFERPPSPHRRHTCVSRSARACVRNGGRGVARTAEKRPRAPLLPLPRSRPCCLTKND